MCFLEGYKDQRSKEELLNNETTNIMKYEVLYEIGTKLTLNLYYNKYLVL